MTLTDITNKIYDEFDGFTIDDVRFDPEINWAKEIFHELTQQKSKEEIENYLIDRFPETLIEGKSFPIKLSINQLNEQIIKSENIINDLENKNIELKKEIKRNKTLLSDIPKKKSPFQSSLREIEEEIEQIKPYSSKAPYEERMNELEKEKKETSLEIENLDIEARELKSEISELQYSAKEINKSIKANVEDINTFELKKINAQSELEQLNKNEIDANEYAALSLLFIILLKKSISKKEITEERKTGNQYQSDYYDLRGNNTFDEVINVKTGEIKPETNDLSYNQYLSYVLSLANKENIIPTNWRKIIYKILTSPLPNLAGTISNYYVNVEALELSNEDTSALLATKIAIKENNSIITTDNKIVLEMSGGIAATISFREKGKQVERFQKEKTEFYSNCISSNRFINQTLYKQYGYTESAITVKTPGAYYILNDKYVIEIYYNPAPILLDNKIEITSNTSDKDKLEDEEEDERIRKQQYEDLYDDDY